jgi:hypothetical protein
MTGPYQVRGRDYLVALLLLAGSAAALGVAQRDQGVMRDEATYFQAGERYWGWFEEVAAAKKRGHVLDAAAPKVIERYFALNNEHPVLCKALSGVSWRIFHGYDGKRGAGFHPSAYAGPQKSLALLSEISAFRLPGWLFAGLAVALLYLFGARIESPGAGLFAGLLYLTIPRLFFHGQLACFDSPMATMWLATVYAYYRSLERARWGIAAGLIFGLALATKHNAWFVPAALLLHYVITVWPDVSLRPFHPPRVPLVFVAMALLGPLVFLAHWPWMWWSTAQHLRGYLAFHLHHSYYNIEYLGTNLGEPPLPASYPFVMTLFTVPTVTLLLALAGLWLYLRAPVLEALGRFLPLKRPPVDDRFRYPARRSWLRPGQGLDPRLGWLLFLNTAVPLVVIALPSTPHFGGTKHWLPAYPFVALLGGVALHRLVRLARTRIPRGRVLAALLFPVVLLPGVLGIVFTHPFGLTQYNALAGGPAGGADLGLNRQFWGYASRQLLPFIDGHAARGARVYFHDTNYDSFGAYVRDGLLRPDIVYAGMERPAVDGSDWAMVLHELHFNKYDYWIWDAYQTAAPVQVLDLDGVPVVSLYQRPPRTGSGGREDSPKDPDPSRSTRNRFDHRPRSH